MASASNDNNYHLPKTYSEAQKTGSLYYFTGKPCSRGHIAKRYAKTGTCQECHAELTRRINREKSKSDSDYVLAKNENNKLYARRKWASMSPGERAECVERSRRRVVERCESDPDFLAKIRLYKREYKISRKKTDPSYIETLATYDRNRRARIRDVGGSHTSKDVADILKRQKYKCAECGASVRERKSRHVDHVMPIALGGANDPANLQILCPPCNLSKGAKHPLDYARQKGRLL